MQLEAAIKSGSVGIYLPGQLSRSLSKHTLCFSCSTGVALVALNPSSRNPPSQLLDTDFADVTRRRVARPNFAGSPLTIANALGANADQLEAWAERDDPEQNVDDAHLLAWRAQSALHEQLDELKVQRDAQDAELYQLVHATAKAILYGAGICFPGDDIYGSKLHFILMVLACIVCSSDHRGCLHPPK